MDNKFNEMSYTMIILNNLNQSMNNINELNKQLEDAMEKTFIDVTEKDKFQIKNCLDLLNETYKIFDRILEKGINKFTNHFFFNDITINQAFHLFRNFNYKMDEKQYLNVKKYFDTLPKTGIHTPNPLNHLFFLFFFFVIFCIFVFA